MEEIIEQLKQEEKKAEKRLANVKMLINISESANAIMESFAKINKINFEIKKKEFDDALNEKLKKLSFEDLKIAHRFGLENVIGKTLKIDLGICDEVKQMINDSVVEKFTQYFEKNSINTLGFFVRDVSKLKEAVDKDFKESEIKFEKPNLKRRIVSAMIIKNVPFEFNGKTYKADLEKGDVVYIEEDKVWLKRELKNGVAIISNGDDIFCFQENDKWFYKFELIAE